MKVSPKNVKIKLELCALWIKS